MERVPKVNNLQNKYIHKAILSGDIKLYCPVKWAYSPIDPTSYDVMMMCDYDPRVDLSDYQRFNYGNYIKSSNRQALRFLQSVYR
jgi:hypothetical protein